MKKNCTDIFLRFREIARLTWNVGLWPEPELRQIEPVMRYEEAMKCLFEAMAWHLCADDRIEVGKPLGTLCYFTVEVKDGDIAQLLIDRNSPDEPGHVWGDPVLEVTKLSCRLRFVAFFDWHQLAPLDLRLLRVLVEALPERPDLVGREALIEFDKCDIWV